jgi:hypothetical protein
MYESFYNLRTRAFALLPDSDFLYAGSTHRAAYSALEYGLINEASFMVLTGEPGMGKTSLLRKLIAEHGIKHSSALSRTRATTLNSSCPGFSCPSGYPNDNWTRLRPIMSSRSFSFRNPNSTDGSF